ncbi:phosphoglycerate mutase family protein [Tenacibaculum sp. 190524A05c]|uniref:phosphoglycerate mutase family protein n=1 Tax=Tenacibaculum platacis TaxID=3137852 RepID=UPI0031FB14ED
MKKVILVLVFIFGIQSITAQSETTTYYLIRHTDKVLTNKGDRDPDLTKKGYLRAQKWAEVLSDVKFDMVYSSNYKRTIETAKPTAKANNIGINFYNPKKSYDKAFQKATKGKTVLIVGHSNSTPSFVNKILGESKYVEIDESNYTNLYIVNVNKESKNSTLLHVDF